MLSCTEQNQRHYTDLGFCDDNEARRDAIETDYRTVRVPWEAEAAAGGSIQPLIQAALEASLTAGTRLRHR